jgi:hypothetical protein
MSDSSHSHERHDAAVARNGLDAPPLSAPEFQAIAERTRIRSYASLIGAVATVFAMLGFVIVGVLFLNKANQENLLQASTNCARKYSSILSGPVTLRDNLTSQVAALVGQGQGIFDNALLADLQNGAPPTPAAISAFAANRTALATTTNSLNQAIAVVKKEPTNAEATTKGFTFAGVHHPACPSG